MLYDMLYIRAYWAFGAKVAVSAFYALLWTLLSLIVQLRVLALRSQQTFALLLLALSLFDIDCSWVNDVPLILLAVILSG